MEELKSMLQIRWWMEDSFFIYAVDPEHPTREMKVAELVKDPGEPYLMIRFSEVEFRDINGDKLGLHYDLLLDEKVEFKEIIFPYTNTTLKIPRDWFLKNAKLPNPHTWDSFAWVPMSLIIKECSPPVYRPPKQDTTDIKNLTGNDNDKSDIDVLKVQIKNLNSTVAEIKAMLLQHLNIKIN